MASAVAHPPQIPPSYPPATDPLSSVYAPVSRLIYKVSTLRWPRRQRLVSSITSSAVCISRLQRSGDLLLATDLPGSCPHSSDVTGREEACGHKRHESSSARCTARKISGLGLPVLPAEGGAVRGAVLRNNMGLRARSQQHLQRQRGLSARNGQLNQLGQSADAIRTRVCYGRTRVPSLREEQSTVLRAVLLG